MYLRRKDGQPHRRVIFTKEEKEAVLTEMRAGHFGVKGMIAKVNQSLTGNCQGVGQLGK
jgi:hypothetical protein